MESYKARGSTTKAAKKLLLPISFGPSSTCLLHILDHQLQAQLDRMGRTSYELVLVHVVLENEFFQHSKDLWGRLQSRFPKHKYVMAGLEEALDLRTVDWNMFELENPEAGPLMGSPAQKFERLMASVSSVTSKADVGATLLLRLLVSIAEAQGCESILFGDSTTRLAEKTLTETAKGRGFSLPWQVSDGMSPYGVHFHYPLRDLLKKEILTFSSLTTPVLTDLIVYQSPSAQVSASSKSTTIDDLMAQYFESVEENYPSIVANVVRTASKLNPPAVVDNCPKCTLCGLPVTDGTNGINGWGGDQSSDTRPPQESGLDVGILCYGCARSING